PMRQARRLWSRSEAPKRYPRSPVAIVLASERCDDDRDSLERGPYCNFPIHLLFVCGAAALAGRSIHPPSRPRCDLGESLRQGDQVGRHATLFRILMPFLMIRKQLGLVHRPTMAGR